MAKRKKKYQSQFFTGASDGPYPICFCEPNTPEAKKIKVEWGEEMKTYMLYVTPVYSGVVEFLNANVGRNGSIEWEGGE